MPYRNEHWRYRRRLVYGTVGLAAFMILFAAFTFDRDAQVSSQMVMGGVSLLTLVLTSYVFAATLDDKWSKDGWQE